MSTFPHGYALLVGVGASAYPPLSIPVTVKDVEALQAVLIEPARCGFPDSQLQLLRDSSRGTQSSWIRPDQKMSIYTHHLIEALHGAGSHSGDTIIRLSHLMAHLAAAVPKSAKDLCKAEQTPFFDTAAEDFPVAALLGGKGLPAGGWQEVASKVTEAHRPTVQASGARSIAIGGDVHSSMLITGNNNQVTVPKK